ncbi:hypothetical protein [Nonomuraea sp. SYSU D8015]|uniref:hypothetical protein n=1 Tax=Nonomuraea sp. SYSU D8015 TaxID=2593644 RepID=UPI00166070D8|nr:hypothetical protein [Nonomuraea sp. SYSU D8015]
MSSTARVEDLLSELTPQVLGLYGLLERLTGDPMVALNRAVAAAEISPTNCGSTATPAPAATAPDR